jgi:hypothetical protein
MIHTYFWPSTASKAEEWDSAINQAINEQTYQFPGVEILNTVCEKEPRSNHVTTSIEVGRRILADKLFPSIYFIQLCEKDVPEESRLTFPESILHLDILARLSQTSVIAVIDNFSANCKQQRKQLESVTYVENTCTTVSQFKPYLSLVPYRPRLYDKKLVNQLVFDAVYLLKERQNLRTFIKEP